MEDQKAPIWLTNSNNNSLSNSDRSTNHGHPYHHHHNQNLQQIVKHHHHAQQQDIKDAEKPWNSNPNSREFNIHQPHGFLHLNPETIPASSSSSTPPPANPNNINTDLHQTSDNNIAVQTDQVHQTSNSSITAQAELLNHNRHSHGLNNLSSSDPLSVSAPPSLQCLLQPNTSSSSSSSSSLSSSSSSLSSSASLSSRLKAEITVHPLYNQLLSAHVACLRIATPVDQLPLIDAQIARSPQISSKYLQILSNANSGNNMNQKSLDGSEDREELDQFMAHYVLLLCSFKEQLQQHVKVHAMEAVMACWDLEQSLLSLTGVSPGEASGATMSDDDDDYGYGVGGREDDLGSSMLVDSINGHHHDLGGYGPLIPTETERTLMEKVRQELKNELKNGYKDRIVDVREEILRKRRAGKLPGDTTSVLKSWWHCHAKWPYPTEDEKARLVQETGLQLKQINNWFINQRKRNWHSNPSSSSSLKSKRKR